LNADGKRVVRVPLIVEGQLLFDEKILEATSGSDRLRSVQYYRQAAAKLRVGEDTHAFSLDGDRNLIVAEMTDQDLVLFSPLGPLTREELELIDTQGNVAVVHRLLPATSKAIGETWEHDKTTMAALLGLDSITECQIESVLREVKDSIAIIELKGTAEGVIRGVSSEIQVAGKYNFDLQQKRITWLALSIEEDRAIGHAEPGLEVVARIRMATGPASACPELADQALEDLDLVATMGAKLLQMTSATGQYRFLHDRDWRVMVDRHDVTILRLLDGGDLISQCNVSQLPNLPAGQHVQLEAFQADIQRALGESFGEFASATQTETENGLRILRAVVAGTASELPIQWTYYHIADDRGRQIALVFTLDARLVERFAEADQMITSSFEFLELADSAAERSEAAAAETSGAAGQANANQTTELSR
jgi:hypothetical protein